MDFHAVSYRLLGKATSRQDCLSKLDLLYSLIEKEVLFIDERLYAKEALETGEYIAHTLAVVEYIERVWEIAPCKLSQWRAFYQKASPLEVSEFHIQQCKRKIDQLQRVIMVSDRQRAS